MANLLLRSSRFRRMLGVSLAEALAFVYRTNTVINDPVDFWERYGPRLPIVAAMWHGQHFLMPLARPDGMTAKVMISRSADGDINAIAAERLGLGLIRASGGRTAAQIKRKHGIKGFFEALSALEAGCSVALTADVPKVSRVVGPGIVKIASASGRPIMPMAAATSRRITLNNWDGTTINLPFGRLAVSFGEPIPIGRDLSDAELEAARCAVADGLNETTARAYAIADGLAQPAEALAPAGLAAASPAMSGDG